MVRKGLLKDEDSIHTLFKGSMGLFKEVDTEGYDTYTAYWTHGHDMLVFQTHSDDKEIAEWILNHLVCRYWKNKLNKIADDSYYDTITKHYNRMDYGE